MVIEKLSLTCDRLLSHRQLACCQSYCGIPLDGMKIQNVCPQPLLLTGHHGEISAMTFGKGSGPVLLCSASADYIIVWDIELCQKRTKEGKVAAGTVIGSLLGEVVYLSFLISTLTSHLGPLTSAEFCPWNKDILVTTSEDRTFKVWDLKTETVCYQSFVLSGMILLLKIWSEQIHFPVHNISLSFGIDAERGLSSSLTYIFYLCFGHTYCRSFILINVLVFVSLCLMDRLIFLYKGGIKEQPLVFHSKVKSSGYTSAPSHTLFPAGHDKPVSSVSWSLNRQWWLSASEDQSLRIWTHGSPEPAIIMGDSLFSKPIKSAQFYYLDKFLLLASGPSLYLYLYNVDITRDDIKRYQQRSVIKLARCITTTSATDITALSAINDFFSYIVLVCGSDRSIQVFDMNKGTVASALPDAHSRAVHCITQNKGSMFSTQAPDSYNLFLTSAVTDGVKIWDLRSLRCVRRYENHLNRCHPCSSAISPCGRFIASGSEDNCAYVYDIRSSRYLHRLQKHSDTVLSVTFNPATPEVRTCLYLLSLTLIFLAGHRCGMGVLVLIVYVCNSVCRCIPLFLKCVYKYCTIYWRC
uniref:WD repeat domain 27 n=1 Tax=Sander lucioperca TaxID=283035 RepID=A0A8C9XHS2_SANLU